MSYETLEKQIRALPLEAQEEIAHYVGYLFSLYNSVNQKNAISEKINTFMKNNPTAFNEFSDIQMPSILHGMMSVCILPTVAASP